MSKKHRKGRMLDITNASYGSFAIYAQPDGVHTKVCPILVTTPRKLENENILVDAHNALAKLSYDYYVRAMVLIAGGKKYELVENAWVNATSAHWHMQLKYLVRANIIPQEAADIYLSENMFHRSEPDPFIMQDIERRHPISRLHQLEIEADRILSTNKSSSLQPGRIKRNTADEYLDMLRDISRDRNTRRM